MRPKKKANKMARKNSRFQSKAERDRAMVARPAKNVKDLKDRLNKYDDLKEKGQVKRGLAAMAGTAAAAKYFGGKLAKKYSNRTSFRD